ncbi:MAG: hypothetical protein GY811_20055 [Myxococcales bacterium]|nr:hypothetical protein [Myxococcales bacterium]
MRWGLALAFLGLSACGGTSTATSSPSQRPESTSEATTSKESTSKELADPNFPSDGVKPGWNSVDEAGRKRISEFADEYLTYVQEARTTRQSTRALLAMATEAGAVPWDSAKKPGPGQLLYWHDAASSSLAVLRVGSEAVDEGIGVVLASQDSALIRLTPSPIYERSGLALFDTSIMGTLKLESWLHTPLALSLYQAAASPGAKVIDIVLGDEEGEPVFTIPDLLPHLSSKVQRHKLVDSPERLDVVAGFTAKALSKTLSSHGISTGALASIEATLVPAGEATYVGVDQGLIAGANHHSRAVPFVAMNAVLGGNAGRTTLLILMGRNQQFYAGAGAEGHVASLLPKAIETLDSNADALKLRRILARTNVLMFDHSSGTRNGGVVLGTRRDDSSPSAFRQVLQLFEEGKVVTQLIQTSGWSDAREVASLDIDTVAIGLPVSGFGMPYELISTFDLYQALAACRAWVSQ